MYCVAAIIFVGALWGWPGQVEGVDCNDQTSLRNEMSKCFGQIVGEVGSFQDLQNAIQNNASFACSHFAQYKSGVSCVMTIARNCLETLGQNTDLLPDPDKMADALEYLCQNIGGFDSECLQKEQQDILQCVEIKASAVGRTSSDRSEQFIYCTGFDLTLECTGTELATCPAKTRDVFVQYMKYLSPPVCGACAGGASCLLLLFAALLAMACRYSDV